jgi:type I restriction enzyme S subunit
MEAAHKPIGELLDAVPRQPKIKRSAYQDSGRYPIVDQSQSDIAGYTDDESWLYQGELPVVIFGDHTRVLKLVNFPFCVGADGTQLLRPVAGNDIRYFYYALRNVDLTNYGYERHFKYLKEEEIPVPPLPLQRRIAGILSAYDELMENSQRRIRLLEAMARALYREWFVHFRFPGHEKHPRVASPLGDIPQGWEVKTIADVCESVSYGYTASASREEVGPKFLRITDIVPATIDWAGVPFCEIPEDKATKYLLKPGDIVVARTGATTGYAKRLNKLHPDTVFASYLVRARAKAGVSNRMLGIVMESDEYKQYIQTNIGGAAQPQANAVVLTSMRLAVPPSSVGEKFDRLVAPMIDEAELLAVKIQNLRRTRDLLLPRLLSGQVELETEAA